MLLKKKHLFSGNGLANANREEKRISEEAVILHGAPTLAGIKTGSLFRCEYESIDPASIRHILITHQDTDHVGALETDSEQLFKDAAVYIGEIENRYLTGEVRRKVMHKLYKLPPVKMNNQKVLLQDGQVLNIERIGPKNTRKVIQIAVSKSYRNRDVHAASAAAHVHYNVP